MGSSTSSTRLDYQAKMIASSTRLDYQAKMIALCTHQVGRADTLCPLDNLDAALLFRLAIGIGAVGGNRHVIAVHLNTSKLVCDVVWPEIRLNVRTHAKVNVDRVEKRERRRIRSVKNELVHPPYRRLARARVYETREH